jgi:hypothetical protein
MIVTVQASNRTLARAMQLVRRDRAESDDMRAGATLMISEK